MSIHITRKLKNHDTYFEKSNLKLIKFNIFKILTVKLSLAMREFKILDAIFVRFAHFPARF